MKYVVIVLSGMRHIEKNIIGNYSSVGFAKIYTAKILLTAVDELNDLFLPFFQEQNTTGFGNVNGSRDRVLRFAGQASFRPYSFHRFRYAYDHLVYHLYVSATHKRRLTIDLATFSAHAIFRET